MLSFQEYLEDVIDQHEALMSAEQLTKAREDYKLLIAPKKAAASEAHPDMKQTIASLRARCERLVAGQSGAIDRVSAKPEFSAAIVAEGRAILAAKRATKAEYIAHAANNSAASRLMNAVK